jgi:hypothetical protein
MHEPMDRQNPSRRLHGNKILAPPSGRPLHAPGDVARDSTKWEWHGLQGCRPNRRNCDRHEWKSCASPDTQACSQLQTLQQRSETISLANYAAHRSSAPAQSPAENLPKNSSRIPELVRAGYSRCAKVQSGSRGAIASSHDRRP